MFQKCHGGRGVSTTDCIWTDKVNSSLKKSLENLNEFKSSFFDTNYFFEELAKCSQNISCKCDVSKRPAKRYMLKSVLKELNEKKKKFRFFGTLIKFISLHAICDAPPPGLLLGLRETFTYMSRNWQTFIGKQSEINTTLAFMKLIGYLSICSVHFKLPSIYWV